MWMDIIGQWKNNNMNTDIDSLCNTMRAMLKRQISQKSRVSIFLKEFFRPRVLIVGLIRRVVFFTTDTFVDKKLEDFDLLFLNRKDSKISVYPINTFFYFIDRPINPNLLKNY